MMYELGSLVGALNVIGWGAVNTYGAILLGNFRNRHAGIHNVADMAELIGGIWLKELIGALFIIGNVLAGGTSMFGLATGLNALSHHAACTVWFGFISLVAVTIGASLRKFHTVGWLTWVGFVSIFTAVFIVV